MLCGHAWGWELPRLLNESSTGTLAAPAGAGCAAAGGACCCCCCCCGAGEPAGEKQLVSCARV